LQRGHFLPQVVDFGRRRFVGLLHHQHFLFFFLLFAAQKFFLGLLGLELTLEFAILLLLLFLFCLLRIGSHTELVL
jgi:hypothetical protein